MSADRFNTRGDGRYTGPQPFGLDPDAPAVPDGYRPRAGVEVGCGVATCADCYEAVEQCDWCGRVYGKSTMRETSDGEQLACADCWLNCVECPQCKRLGLESESDEGYHPRCHPSNQDDDPHDREGFFE